MKIINGGNLVMNTYVYKAPCGYVMVDTGYEHSLRSVEKKLGRNGICLADIQYIFLTHAHDDHAGFLNELLSRNQHLKVILSDKAMETLKRGQNSFDGGCSTLLAWAFCKLMGLVGKAEHRFPAIEDKYQDRFLEVMDINRPELEALLGGTIVETPGHTVDSISLVTNRVIFCGDAAMNDFPSVKRLIIWIHDTVAFGESWNLLLQQDAELIYPAHGRPFPKRDLAKFRHCIEKVRLYSLK